MNSRSADRAGRSFVCVTFLVLLAAAPAPADVQKILVGGELRVRGNGFDGVRGAAVTTQGNSTTFVEQRTRLNVRAEFTHGVSAYAEFDSYDIWGEDFRSDYVTGMDIRASTGDDIEVYQAYVQLSQIWDSAISLRIGRQEVFLGSEWLVGNNDTGSFVRGLSFDGLRLDWARDAWSVQAGGFRVAENSPIEEDGDVDFYMLDVAYTGIDKVTLSAYWLYLRDARGSRLGFPFDTPNGPDPVMPTLLAGRIEDAIEDVFNVDQYDDTTSIHTFGFRAAGAIGRWDLEAEFAYQHIEPANITKRFFNPDPASLLDGQSLLPFGGPYGEDDADFDLMAFNFELGYTFDWSSARPFLGAAYFEGRDNRATDFGQFVRNLIPFFEQNTSMAFNRLFSDWEYSDFLDDTDLSNVWILRGGVEVTPLETVHVALEAVWFQADDRAYTNGVYIFPFLAFPHTDELGWELRSRITYAYSPDLEFSTGYSRFFAADGLDDGNFVRGNGLFLGQTSGDQNYFWIETRLRF